MSEFTPVHSFAFKSTQIIKLSKWSSTLHDWSPPKLMHNPLCLR